MNRKGLAPIFAILIVLAAATITGGGYYVFHNKTVIKSVVDSKTYRNEQYGFEFQYAQNWKLSEAGEWPYLEGGWTTELKGKAIFLCLPPTGCQDAPITISVVEISTPDALLNLKKYIGRYGELTNFNLGGFPAIKSGSSVIVKKGGVALVLFGSSVAQTVFDQIISTFKFTNPEEVLAAPPVTTQTLIYKPPISTEDFVPQKIDKFGIQIMCPENCKINEQDGPDSAYISLSDTDKVAINRSLDDFKRSGFGKSEYPIGEYFGGLIMYKSQKLKDDQNVSIYIYDFKVDIDEPEIGISGGKTSYYLRGDILDKKQEFGSVYQNIISFVQSGEKPFNQKQKDLFMTILSTIEFYKHKISIQTTTINIPKTSIPSSGVYLGFGPGGKVLSPEEYIDYYYPASRQLISKGWAKIGNVDAFRSETNDELRYVVFRNDRVYDFIQHKPYTELDVAELEKVISTFVFVVP